jgi:hypothetical protein
MLPTILHDSSAIHNEHPLTSLTGSIICLNRIQYTISVILVAILTVKKRRAGNIKAIVFEN